MENPAKLENRTGYRADIDGLRAVAVLLVIADHLRTRVMGGYVGVDVFFVISGYLISAHILSSLEAGRFSIVDFYERRIRRIFPALLVMLAFCCVAAYILLLPTEAEDFGRSLIAALLSVSNFLFWSQSGYFDAPSASKPLLHTWSLGVEEQFYVFFPLLIIAVRRWLPSRLKLTIWAMFFLSFAAACFYVRRDASAAFFFSPLRAWELLTGTVLSQKYLPQLRTAWQRNTASALGLLLILVPALHYDAATPFPGLAALPVCVGSALIIAAGDTGTSLIGRALAWRPVVFIGLISYSLYLWHWPIIVFWTRSNIVGSHTLTPAHKFGLLIASLLAGTLCWWLVERPFRTGRWRPTRRTLFSIASTATAALLIVGLITVRSHGLSSRFSPEAMEILNYDATHASGYRESVCFLTPPTTFAQFNQQTCLGPVPNKPQMLLLGDSLAAHLYPGLAHTFPQLNISQANSAFCLPLIHRDPNIGPFFLPNCQQMNDYIFGTWLLQHHPDAVLLAGSWQPQNLPALAETIQWLQQHSLRVIVFGPVPDYDISLPLLLATALRAPHPDALLQAHRIPWTAGFDKTMASLARNKWKVEYISAFADLCGAQVEMVARSQLSSGDGCPVLIAPGVPLQIDQHHFSQPASDAYAEAMKARHQLP